MGWVDDYDLNQCLNNLRAKAFQANFLFRGSMVCFRCSDLVFVCLDVCLGYAYVKMVWVNHDNRYWYNEQPSFSLLKTVPLGKALCLWVWMEHQSSKKHGKKLVVHFPVLNSDLSSGITNCFTFVTFYICEKVDECTSGSHQKSWIVQITIPKISKKVHLSLTVSS